MAHGSLDSSWCFLTYIHFLACIHFLVCIQNTPEYTADVTNLSTVQFSNAQIIAQYDMLNGVVTARDIFAASNQQSAHLGSVHTLIHQEATATLRGKPVYNHTSRMV